MEPRTIAGVVRSRAVGPAADRVAVRFKVGDGWAAWNWAEFWHAARGAGAGLRAAGVRPGDHVLILEPEIRTAVTCLFGLWAVGAVPIPVALPAALPDPAAFLDRLRKTARRLDARAVLVPRALAAAGAGASPQLLATADVLGADPSGPLPDSDESRGPAFIQLTSGSTGHPRGVVVPHDRLLRHLATIHAALPCRGDPVYLSWLPFFHDMGLVGGLLMPLFAGVTAHLISTADFRSRPSCWLEAMSYLRVTHSPAPPSAYALCVALAPRLARAGLDLSAWEYAIVGAEPISAALLRNFARAFAPCGFRADAFFPVYGLAEATLAVTFPAPGSPVRIDRVDRTALEREGQAVPAADDARGVELVGVGRPLPGMAIQVTDEAGRPLPERVAGEVRVRSDTLSLGYYDEPERTTAAFDGPWLRTGDLGYQEGGTLFITGRQKDLIIKGGHNLIPSVLEEIAGDVEGVRPGGVAAVGVRSPAYGTEMAYLVVETRLGGEAQTALARRIRAALRGHGIDIDRVVLVPPKSIPKTTSGKLRRAALARALEAADGAADVGRVALARLATC